MHTLTCNSTFGNFKWTAKVEVTEDQAVALANAGLLQIIQRSPASKAEKVLGDYEKRPTDFVRSSIDYSDANAATLAKYLGETIEIGKGDDKVVIGKPVITVEEHEIGATKEPVYAQEKEIVQKHIADKTIATWAIDKIGYNGGGELDVNNVELLKAVKAFKLALLAKEM